MAARLLHKPEGELPGMGPRKVFSKNLNINAKIRNFRGFFAEKLLK